MNGLTPIMDDGTSTQSLKRGVPRRELRIDSPVDDRIPIEFGQDQDRNATISNYPADQEIECSELPLVVELPNEIFAVGRYLNSTTTTRMADENFRRVFEFLSLEPTRRQVIAQEFRKYGALPDDWDGENGYAPAPLDIENAVAFMEHIPDKGIASAKLMVAGDGDVGFYWRHDNFYLEIGFQDGNISFYGKMPEGEKIGGDEIFDVASVPKKLDYWMEFIFSG